MLRKDWIEDWTRRTVWPMTLAILCLITPLVSAGASSYVPAIVATSTSTVAATGLPGDLGDIALDACGNIYTVQQYGGAVVEIPYGGGAATTLVAAGGANYVTAPIWIDGAKANLYFGQGASGVTQIPIVNCVPQTAAKSGFSVPAPLTYYWGAGAIASDSAGDLFFGTNVDCCDDGNELFEVVPGNSKYPDGTAKASSHLVGSLNNPITSIALDPNNNIYYVSNGLLYELAAIKDGYSATPVLFGSGYSTTVAGVNSDGAGNLYVADGGNSTIFEIPYETTGSGSALNLSDQFIVAKGVSIANAVAIAPSGNIFFTNDGSSVYELTQFNANFGSAAVNGTASATVNVVFNAAETPAAIAFSSNSSFVSAGGTCAASSPYTAGSTCTITANFKPTTPGTALGAITLTGSGGTALATVYLQGTGSGAGLTVDSGTIASVGGGLISPMSVALDAAGNSYFADAGAKKVWEVPAGNGTPIAIGSGFSSPSGVAVDGAGDVIIADSTGNNQIVEVPIVNGALSTAAQVTIVTASTANNTPTPIAGAVLSGPTGVTVDGQGNLYIADTGNNRIVFVPYNGSWNVAGASVLGADLTAPLATTVDPSGNLYVADSGSGQVYRLPAPVSSGIQQLVAVGYSKPSALATDASGSLFVVDQGDGNIVRIPSLSGALDPNAAIEVGIGNANPYGLAVDQYGNLYVADSTAGAAYKITRTSTTEAFGEWPVGSPSGALPVKIENEGNQVLTFASPFYTATGNTGDFSLSASPSSACANGGSVPVGAGCELDASFQPTASGTRTETLTLNSNATNSTTAQVVLSGTGATTAVTTTALAITAPASGSPFFGQPVTLTATVHSSSGTPAGNAQLLVDGVITGQATLSGSSVATFTLATGLTGGSHSLQAVYLGSSSFNGSTSSILSVTVSTAPTTSTLATAAPFTDPFSGLPGSSFTFTVTINSTGIGIPTGNVTFVTGSTSLGSVTVAPASGGAFQASLTTTALPVGTDVVTATYSGDANYVTSSTSVTVAIVSAPNLVGTTSGTVLISSNKTSDSSVTFTDTSYGGWQGVVGYQCVASSLPANSLCVFSPGQLIVFASTAGSPNPPLTTTLTVLINNPPNSPAQGSIVWWLGGLTGLLLFWMRRRMMRGAWARDTMLIGAVLLAVAASGLLACSNGVSYATPAGTSTITVVASLDPFVSASTSTTQPCVNATTGAKGPTQGPCSQQTFQIGLTVQ